MFVSFLVIYSCFTYYKFRINIMSFFFEYLNLNLCSIRLNNIKIFNFFNIHTYHEASIYKIMNEKLRLILFNKN